MLGKAKAAKEAAQAAETAITDQLREATQLWGDAYKNLGDGEEALKAEMAEIQGGGPVILDAMGTARRITEIQAEGGAIKMVREIIQREMKVAGEALSKRNQWLNSPAAKALKNR